MQPADGLRCIQGIMMPEQLHRELARPVAAPPATVVSFIPQILYFKTP